MKASPSKQEFGDLIVSELIENTRTDKREEVIVIVDNSENTDEIVKEFIDHPEFVLVEDYENLSEIMRLIKTDRVPILVMTEDTLMNDVSLSLRWLITGIFASSDFIPPEVAKLFFF